MERLNNHSENNEQNVHESRVTSPERHHVAHEHHEESPAEKSKKLAELSKEVEAKAKKSSELHNKESGVDGQQPTHHRGAFHDYGTKQTIKRIQKHLKPAERQFSKVIHSPKIEAISDVAGGTIARPSGLLYGGIFSLLSSLVFYVISKHYGYEYTFFIGILFFVGGFILGILVEIIIKPFNKKSS